MKATNKTHEVLQQIMDRAGKGDGNWYSIRNVSEDRAEVFIYDEIGFFGVSATDFQRDLQNVKAANLDVRLNTPGGEVADGITIHNAIVRHPAHVTVHIDGLAASAGAFIAQAGDVVNIASNGMMMIHDPAVFAAGTAADLRDAAVMLDKWAELIAGIMAKRSGQTDKAIRDAMAAETWYTAEEAVDFGLADEVVQVSGAKGSYLPSTLNRYANTPAAAVALCAESEKTKRDAEQALRSSGFSRSQAERIVSAGWPPCQGEPGGAGQGEPVDSDAVFADRFEKILKG